MSPVIQCQGLEFSYKAAGFGLHIPAFELGAGDTVFLQGESGSGKSTFLNLLAGVLKPQAGSVSLLGHSLSGLRAGQVDRLRVDHVGFVFQQFNLLTYLSVLDNVLLPCRFSPRRHAQASQQAGSPAAQARALLGNLGMGHLLGRPVEALSVGQQQRVAAARAFIGNPELIIADEPTSALDAAHQQQFLDVLLQQASQQGTALLMVSHDARLAKAFNRQLDMQAWATATSTVKATA